MAADEASHIIFAPDDPTLPNPWKALIDGSTGNMYYWNTDTNLTQYEKPTHPMLHLPPLPPGPLPADHPILGANPWQPSLKRKMNEVLYYRQHGQVYTDPQTGFQFTHQYTMPQQNMHVNMAPQQLPEYAPFPMYSNLQGPMHMAARPHGFQHSQHLVPGQQLPQKQEHKIELGSRDDTDCHQVGQPGFSPAHKQSRQEVNTGKNKTAEFKTFEGLEAVGLSPELLQGMRKAGFAGPTQIQAQTWPRALDKKDILAIAKTGSGKTLGYLIPAFFRVRELRKDRNDPHKVPMTVLVLAPTSEAATKIHLEAIKFGQSLGVSCTCLNGGSPKTEVEELEKGADVVVATPNRLFEIFRPKTDVFDKVSMLIIDEADKMLELYVHHIRKIVEVIPKGHQTLLYTAKWSQKCEQSASGLNMKGFQKIGNAKKRLCAPSQAPTLKSTAKELVSLEKLPEMAYDLMLVLQWLPALNIESTRMTLHAGWPQDVHNWEELPFNFDLFSDVLQAAMHDRWPNQMKTKNWNDEEFWLYEWLEHGTKSGLESWQYFTGMVQLHKKVEDTGIFAKIASYRNQPDVEVGRLCKDIHDLMECKSWVQVNGIERGAEKTASKKLILRDLRFLVSTKYCFKNVRCKFSGQIRHPHERLQIL